MSNQVLCPHCNSSLTVTDKFCPHCGKKNEPGEESSTSIKSIVCSSCGMVNPSTNAVCQGCGSVLEVKVYSSQEKVNPSAKQVQSKKRAKKNSPSLLVIGGFIALVAIFIVLEFRNTPADHIPAENATAPQQQAEAGASLLDEIKRLENDIKSDPKDSEALLHLANKLHDAKFYPRAIEAYKNFLKVKPKNTDARVDLGICYFELGESTQAIKEIEAALKIEPKHQMAMFNIGIIRLSFGDLAEAKKWFKKCVDIDPASSAGQRAQELLHQH